MHEVKKLLKLKGMVQRGSWNIPAFHLDSLSEGRASLLGQFGHNDKVGMETKKL